MSIEALDRAVATMKTQDALAAALGIRSPSISGWRERGKVPAERCADIERITAGAVQRHELRPDVFAIPGGTDPAATPSPASQPTELASSTPGAAHAA